MLESFNTRSEMQYQRLTEEEKQKRGILGRLVGIIADFKNSTRNGRKYTEELWDRTFEDPIVLEKLENRCILGELGHPADRQETDIEKVAICLAEKPKKGDDGKLHGVFDILDTPNGRILKALCDYGCNIGVSSRGSGDTTEEYDGTETVEPTTYEFECFDAVILPAVKAARPAYVTESLNTRKTLKTALLEALNSSSEDEQKVMKNTLDELKIDYSTEEENISESVDNIDVEPQEEAAEDNGATLIAELQESLKRQQELEAQVESLQKKLSVCYTKESRYSDRLSQATQRATAHETENSKLTEELNRLNETVKQLTETASQKDIHIAELEENLAEYRTRFLTVREQLQAARSSKTTLDESLHSKSTEVKKLTEELTQLRESTTRELTEARTTTKQLQEKNTQLNDALQEALKDAQIFKSQSTAKLGKAQDLVTKYKSVAKTAVDKYINSQATRLGVSSTEITSRLNESYSFADIDRVCEDVKQYKLNLNSLPFSTIAERKPVKIQIKESKQVTRDNPQYNVDDDIDDVLVTFTN